MTSLRLMAILLLLFSFFLVSLFLSCELHAFMLLCWQLSEPSTCNYAMVFQLPLPCSLLPGAQPVPSLADQVGKRTYARGAGALLRSIFGSTGRGSTSSGSISDGSADNQDSLTSSEDHSARPLKSGRRWPWQRKDTR